MEETQEFSPLRIGFPTFYQGFALRLVQQRKPKKGKEKVV